MGQGRPATVAPLHPATFVMNVVLLDSLESQASQPGSLSLSLPPRLAFPNTGKKPQKPH